MKPVFGIFPTGFQLNHERSNITSRRLTSFFYLGCRLLFILFAQMNYFSSSLTYTRHMTVMSNEGGVEFCTLLSSLCKRIMLTTLKH